MSDLLDKLASFVEQERGAARAEQEEDWRKRLEEKVDRLASRAPDKTRRQLLEELAADDEFLAELEGELVAEADELEPVDDDAGDDADDDDADDDDADEQPTGIRWRREELSVPRIYSGDDEPELVEYLDEEGKTQVRQGRRRGQPVAEEWVEIEGEQELDDDDEEEETSDE